MLGFYNRYLRVCVRTSNCGQFVEMHARLQCRMALRLAPRAVAVVPRIVPLATPARSLSVSPIAFKKKKGGAEPAAAAPAEAQFDPDAIARQMQAHADKCREVVHGLVGSFGRVDACVWLR